MLSNFQNIFMRDRFIKSDLYRLEYIIVIENHYDELNPFINKCVKFIIISYIYSSADIS